MGKHDLLGPDPWPLIGTFSGYLTEDDQPTKPFWSPTWDDLEDQHQETTLLPAVAASDDDTAVLPAVPATGEPDDLDEDAERRRATDVALNRELRADVPFDPRNSDDLRWLLGELRKRWPTTPKREDDSR